MKKSIIIGCMSWGQWGKNLSTKEQIELIQYALDLGNSTFDHADIYGDYTAESEFGIALEKSGIPRDKIQLISKCGLQIPGKTRDNKVKHYNYSKDYIIWSAEQSLKHLKTDYLDTFLLHRPSPLMQNDEIAEAITQLQQSGKIKQFGLSNFKPTQLDLIAKKIKVETHQVEFSLTHPQVMYDGTTDQMQSEGIEAMAWSPLGNFFKAENEQNTRIKAALTTLSEKYNASHNTLLLSWILQHPAHLSPVIGTTNKERIKEANCALNLHLQLEDWFMLLAASQGHEVP